MGTIVVTGGAGFIGCNLVRLVLETTAHRVVVFDKLTYAGRRENLAAFERNERFAFVQGDIADPAGVAALFAAHQPTALLNLAAESHVDRSIDGPATFVRTNIDGTHVLLEATRRWLASTPVEVASDFRFIQISTDEVYGSAEAPGTFTETSPYAPRSPYAASKAAGDHLCLAWYATFGLPAIVVNCTNNFGPHQYPEKLLPLMLLNALEGKPLPIYGDGGNVRDWTFVNDFCDGLVRVLEKGKPGERYNFAAKEERTNLGLVDALLAELERQRPSALGYARLKSFVKDRPGHDRRYSIDATKAFKELGWAPRYRFDVALADTVRWYLDHLDWCRAVQDGTYHRERLGLGG